MNVLTSGRKMIFMEKQTPPVADGNKQNSSLQEIMEGPIFAAFLARLSPVVGL